jgi:glycosyltransferase involved in cell wall biosynthesis
VSNDASLLLDVTRLIWRRSKKRLPTGIDRVCLAYLEHFADRAQAVIHHDRFRSILDRQASQHLFELLSAPRPRFRASLLAGALRNLRRLAERGDNRLYLNIGHTGLNSPGYASWCRREDVRPVYLVHDLIPITHPEFCRPGETEKHRERMRTVLATASAVIGNSQATIDELAGFAAAEGRPMPPHTVAWLGSEESLATSISSPAPTRPTFVVLGTIEGRKNHETLLRVWTRLVERLGPKAPRLLIIGQRGWEAQAVFDRLDRLENLQDAVIELNSCSDDDIAQHLSSSRALLFPSIIEGYGLPLIEALAAGVPVIASDLPVFREIAGNRPDYLDPRDEAAWERAILDYANDGSASRAAQMNRIEGFTPTTWTEHFGRVEGLLRSLG